MKKFAAMFMGPDFIPETHTAEFANKREGKTCIYTVRNKQEALAKIVELKENGFGAIELCGAFSRDFALEMIALTKGEIAIGYSVHEPEQDELFNQFFGGQ